MRVLILSWEYPPNVTGGMGAHVAGLAPALVRAGVEVHLITLQPTSEAAPKDRPTRVEESGQGEEEEGVVVYRVPVAEDKGNVYDQARRTNQVVKAQGDVLLASGHRVDLIHAHDWLVAFAAHSLKHQYRLPLVATIHATERGRVRGNTLRTELQRNIHGTEWWLVYEAWRVIACSYHMAYEVQSFFHAPSEKIDVVPNGVNSYQNGRWTPDILAERRPSYVAPGRQTVFAVGRLVHEKGFHLLIEAIPFILAEFPDTQFVIAGQGPEARSLMRQAKNLGLADYIHFPGFISDEERDCLYRISACAVFPSLYEPFGIVALEAMVAGCPVVATDVGGLREVVRHGKTGVTIYPDDAQSVAWGIRSILRDPKLAATRAMEAQQVVRREFNWDTVAAQTIAVYQRVLDERQSTDWQA